MIPKYITFHNAEEDRVNCVVSIGHATHYTLWNYLKARDSSTFWRPLSGGMVTYCTKRKTFRPTDNSVSLNLVPHDTDAQVLKETLTDNAKLCAFVSDFSEAPDFSFILGSSEVLKPAFFQQGSICGIGKATYRIHDSKYPFKLEFAEVKGETLIPDFIDYMIDRLVV